MIHLVTFAIASVNFPPSFELKLRPKDFSRIVGFDAGHRAGRHGPCRGRGRPSRAELGRAEPSGVTLTSGQRARFAAARRSRDKAEQSGCAASLAAGDAVATARPFSSGYVEALRRTFRQCKRSSCEI